MRALQLAGVAAALLAAAPPLRADESGLYRNTGSDVAVLERASAAGSLLRLPDPRAIQPAPEHLLTSSLSSASRLAPGLALEGPRASFATAMPPGDTLAADASERTAVWSVSSVGSVPLDSSLALFARFGLHYPEAQGQISSLAQVDDLGRVYGLGLRFAPDERVDLRAEMQRFTRVGRDGTADTSAMVFGARIRF